MKIRYSLLTTLSLLTVMRLHADDRSQQCKDAMASAATNMAITAATSTACYATIAPQPVVGIVTCGVAAYSASQLPAQVSNVADKCAPLPSQRGK